MTITVYGASSEQLARQYVEAATDLGREIAQHGHTLLNGAGRMGLMAASANACLQAGGEAIGVIPQFMVDRGWQNVAMTRIDVVSDMHSRKQRMADLSDACIALPGGVGTLEELLEIITWKQLGLYLKPIVILNVGGYYDDLLKQFRRAAEESFMRPQHMALYAACTTATEAVQLCETTSLWNGCVGKFATM